VWWPPVVSVIDRLGLRGLPVGEWVRREPLVVEEEEDWEGYEE
jgi:hypothetical protein